MKNKTEKIFNLNFVWVPTLCNLLRKKKASISQITFLILFQFGILFLFCKLISLNSSDEHGSFF